MANYVSLVEGTRIVHSYPFVKAFLISKAKFWEHRIDYEVFKQNFDKFIPQFLMQKISPEMLKTIFERIIIQRKLIDGEDADLPNGSLINFVGGGEKPIINVKHFSHRRILFPEEVQILIRRDLEEIALLTQKTGTTLEQIANAMQEIMNYVLFSEPHFRDKLQKEIMERTYRGKYISYEDLAHVFRKNNLQRFSVLLEFLRKVHMSKEDLKKLEELLGEEHPFIYYGHYRIRTGKLRRLLSSIKIYHGYIKISDAMVIINILAARLGFENITNIFMTKNIGKLYDKVWVHRAFRWKGTFKCPIIGCEISDPPQGEISLFFYPRRKGTKKKSLRMNGLSIHLVKYHGLFEKGPGSTEDQFYPSSPTEFYEDYIKLRTN